MNIIEFQPTIMAQDGDCHNLSYVAERGNSEHNSTAVCDSIQHIDMDMQYYQLLLTYKENS